MAIPIRGIPVLEGEAARRFLKEAKENEKKCGSIKFSDESNASFRAIMEDAKKRGSLLFSQAMGFLQDNCSVFSLTEERLKQGRPFSCGNKDLDDFFLNDAAKYELQLLGK